MPGPPPIRSKKTAAQADPEHWTFRRLARSCLSWFQRGLRQLLRLAELGRALPSFGPPVVHTNRPPG